MEGISKITYQGKEIMYVNYSVTGGSKEKTLQFISAVTDEYLKYPPKSALALVNVTDFRFDSESLNLMKETQSQSTPHQKKVALVGLKPIHQAAFNFGFAISFNKVIRVFGTEEEAKEWLVKD